MMSRKLAVVTAAAMTVGLLAGCKTNTTNGSVKTSPSPVVVVNPPAGNPAPSATTSPSNSLSIGNCTRYPKEQAVTLLGAVNFKNTALNIGTDGGTKIDECSYLDLKGTTDLQGVSYAVVLYDSDATAFAEAKKVQTEMLGDATEHSWQVQSLTTPAPGAGPVLGGYGTKTDNGLTYTIAVVGTNVGPYLVAALGASTESVGNAKQFALKLFGALASTTT